ncbi:hypothetical protein EPR50_G00066570 [Perca flavescens]|uniref:C2H2-type domain-containing protein n=1 Tax=Perca flavescens TaxID=8167 RepID=A0A484D9U6_PERFV|nr:hypothetical protein EPR50_G00066570 [Perca flavescens]
MQSPTQSNCRPNPVTTATTEQPLDTETEDPPAQSEPDAQEKENEPDGTAAVVSPQENGTGLLTVETPASMAVTQSVENEPAVQPLTEPPVDTAGMETSSASKSTAPTEPMPDMNANPGCGEQKAKKQNTGIRDGRKYVPSKKAMVDPLKMDMSKPLVMPLTSSQLSLQCIECHIIFSDHKSKERHLKLSHPAEYEQCILRNALFACYVCDRHFTNSTELMIHQKAHTEKKPFKCPICGQAFNKSSELTLHKKIHFGQDGYACADCGKPCKTMTLLKYHRRTHTGERPYVCKECGKRFTMSKALQKHMVSHLPEGAEGDGGDTTAKAPLKKDNGASTIKYPCLICKSTFKSTKTRLHHMKTKHNVLPAAASKTLPAGQQVKQSTPIITPISFCQPALLQMEPNGPLQKVDANIDTEQIRRLIESLGNVQKVNQVVILGQVPPHAPPLEVQQISQMIETGNYNLNPPQMDFLGLKQPESKIVELDPSNNTCYSMEQTIILEPITPDEQLENPSFSELGSHIASGENMELTFNPTQHTEGPEGEVMHQILQQPDISAIQSDPMDQMVCQNEVEENLEQTVILELIPTVELEQSQTVPQNDILSSLVPTTDLEKTADQTVLDEQEASLSAPPLMTTVELELTPLQTEQQGLPSCPFVTPDTLTQTPSESETNLKEKVDSQIQTVSLDQGHPVMDGAAPQEQAEEPSEQEPSEKLLVDSKKDQEQVENLSEVEVPPAKEDVPSHLETKQASRQAPETLPTKPKTTRKRKASSKVETEGVITSHSKRALECKECGQRFSEVSSLQKHKATVHIVESPGLTYTNGNIFEGVSRLDLYQLPKLHGKVVGVMHAATDWDTEPEMAEMALEERERSVSFPALIPSPSLPVPPSDVEVSSYENKTRSKTGANDQSYTSPEVCSPSDQFKTCEAPPNFTSECPLSTSTQTKSSDTGEPLASDEHKQEEGTLRNPSSESEVQGTTHEDVKEDLLFEVDLVTVGEQNERDEPTSHEATFSQNESNGTCNSEGGSTDKLPGQISNEITTGKSLTSQTVSCSTHQVDIKEEEEEMLVQKKKGEKGSFLRNGGRRRATGRLKRDPISKRVSAGDTIGGTESEKEQDDEKRPISSDSEMNDEGEACTKTSQTETSPETNKATAPATPLPSMPSTLEESPEDRVAFEPESVTTSVEEAMNVRGLQGREEHDRDADHSPVIILEKFLTSRQTATADKEPCLMTARNRKGLDCIAENEARGSQEIKVEENMSEPPLVAPICQNRQSASVQPQHHRDIRTVLVKEESCSLVLNEAQDTQGSRHIRWNVEPVNIDSSSPLMESGETTRKEGCVTPEFNTNQCIFYPVKEEEREVLLGAVQTNSGDLTTGPPSDAQQMEHQAADSNLDEWSPSALDYQEMRVRGLLSEPGVSDFADGQAEADTEWQHPQALRDFLLQSSDEEDVGGFELSDPQLDSEAEVMAYFYKNQKNTAWQPDEMSENLPTSTSQLQTPREENRTREPIDYFSKYFGWDTWVEIAHCTNKLSNMAKPFTAREVARFVGIHIAMGTLKFPSPRLYWEDLTKVPLIADAMPFSRFLELSRTLKLASPVKDPVNSNVQEGRHEIDFQNAQQGKTLSNRQSEICQRSDGQRQGDTPTDPNSSKTETDPLWKAQPLLCRFKAGCQSLRQEGDYAVDQYPLPLTGKMHNKKLSLNCTTLIGFGGFLLHVDLKLGLSGKEDAVEKMVPKGSMVFLCKQELSTPAMLERLLVAGVHGAGRVGGARGQIGDEFVSSDGKLMLRRSHCGFILSTAGHGQRNMASLIDNFEMAQMSAHLNRDLLNLYSIPLTASAPTCWPQAVLWYLTDLALVNSWLLHRQEHGAASAPLTLMAFRLEVSKALILSSGSDTQDSVSPQPPKDTAHATNETPNPSLVEESPLPDAATRYDGSGHWPEQLGEGEGGRCRFGDCQRTSRVLCLKCCVFLCISRNHNCFLNFHNQGSLGKE